MEQLAKDWSGLWSKNPVGVLCVSNHVSNTKLAEAISLYVDRIITKDVKKRVNELNPSFFEKYSDEVVLLLRLLLAVLTIGKSGRDIGDIAANLKRRTALIVLDIVTPYLFAKVKDFMMSSQWSMLPQKSKRRNFWQACNTIEVIVHAISAANFFRYLQTGKYATLSERVLEVKRVPCNPALRIDLPLASFKTQEAFDALTEVFLFAVKSSPAIRFVKRELLKIYRWAISVKGKKTAPSEALQTASFDTITCPVCGIAPPSMPFRALPCGHIYCYYCIASCLLDEENVCERCGSKISGLERFLPKAI